MSMALWRHKVWIPAASVALAAAIGLWYERSDHRRTIADEADMASDIIAYHAIAQYSTSRVVRTCWISPSVATSAVAEVWGGYASITCSLPAPISAALSGAYAYSARARAQAGFYADRGWVEVYTNTAGGAWLYDLGPAGGGYAGVRIGGWALRGGFPATRYALPRHFGLSSARFLRILGTTSYELRASDYDPADIIVSPGAIDTNRVTYWCPPTLTAATNSILMLPLRDEIWTADGDGIGPADYQAPRTVYAPQSPWARNYYNGPGGGLDMALWEIMENAGPEPYESPPDRPWVDEDRASPLAPTSFDGWTNAAPPFLNTSTNFLAARAAWEAVNPGTNLLAYWQSAVGAMEYMRAFRAGGEWTNGWHKSWRSRTVSGHYSSAPAMLESLRTNAQWSVETDESSVLPPRYEFSVSVFEDWPTWQITAYYAYVVGQPVGYLGIGHGTQLYARATCHTWPIGLLEGLLPVEIPPDENMVAAQMLRAVATHQYVPGPSHQFTVCVPSWTNEPPSVWWPTNITLAGQVLGYELAPPVILAAPVFD